jgi:hypothetical protein
LESESPKPEAKPASKPRTRFSLIRLIVSYLLHHGVKNSDLTDWNLNVKDVDGTYTLDLAATVIVETKKELSPGERRSKNLIIIFLVSLFLMLGLDIVGMLLPDAGLGRTLVLLGTIPAFIVNLVSASFLIKRHRAAT